MKRICRRHGLTWSIFKKCLRCLRATRPVSWRDQMRWAIYALKRRELVLWDIIGNRAICVIMRGGDPHPLVMGPYYRVYDLRLKMEKRLHR